MARPTTWRRIAVQFAPTGLAVGHDYRGIAVFEGETVGRIHFQYQWSTLPDTPFAPWGVQGMIGVRVQDDLSTVPTLELPQDISAEEWMWIEGVGWRGEFGAFDLTTGDPVSIMTAPSDGGYRDIKAMRKVTADGAIWVQDSCVAGAGNQGNHYLSFFMSALIILPA